MANYPVAKKGIFSKQYVNFIYIPSALLLVGCAITKVEWLPYAAGLAIALGSWQFYDMRMLGASWLAHCLIIGRASPNAQGLGISGL